MTVAGQPAPRSTYLFLAIGLIVASQSGNIIRLGAAHPVAITAWRLAIATLILAPVAGGDLRALLRLPPLDRGLLVLAGVALAAHFFAWIAAVQHTTVANAAVFFAVNPVMTAGAAHVLFRERITPRFVAAVALGIVGVTIIGGEDFRLQRDHLTGDALAVLCSALFTVYFLLGKRLRRRVATGPYVVGVYGVAAVFSFVTVAVLGLPAVDYDGPTWLCFALLALLPTVIGHTSFNHALQTIDASRISAATLTEPALASVVAFFAWDEAVTAGTIAGYAVIAASVIVLVSDRPGATPEERGGPS